MYGSTEMMDITYAAFRSVDDLDSNSEVTEVAEVKVPIGRPIFNSIAYVLDENMKPVPRGEIGQLFVSDESFISKGGHKRSLFI